ncbi:MAG: hypothetical protein VYA42_01220, partial [Pseudomonadota bacterium]|nr:hypothetical protein [Pseudomonadota bacterium]
SATDGDLRLGDERDDFVTRIVGDRDCRKAVNRHLRGRAIHAEGPWRVQPVDEDDIADFL